MNYCPHCEYPIRPNAGHDHATDCLLWCPRPATSTAETRAVARATVARVIAEAKEARKKPKELDW